MITNLTGTPVASLLQPNGNILVSLFNGTTATVARFLPSGALDTSFGSGGVAQTAISGSAELGLDGSGKILVESGTGSTSNTLAFVVERLNPNGQPDPTFGSNGVASANSSGKSATCLLVQPDGKVLIGGDRIQTGRPEKEFGLIMRFNSDGTLDTAFGNAGQVNLSPATAPVWRPWVSTPAATSLRSAPAHKPSSAQQDRLTRTSHPPRSQPSPKVITSWQAP
ncbi:MAG: hypothetical protein JOY56_10820 [Solirubrobacterales bacterium]|nr:hypothetical protein [Solirubrobacterales bacterium]